ncbi:anti-sigma factor RsbA family regulatory protein [Actinoplanes sp. NPDC051494]|uniref:anti-sigma factor RsbA family regulatory protein n=1 Tax=Actinoplanes sp. NPDC051494 TaxID=3363907 RepID=UPI003797DA1E
MVFVHSAFLYADDAAYASTLSGFVRDGLAGGEAVAVAAPADRIRILREALGGDAAEVRFLPADEWFVRPVRTIAAWSHILRDAVRGGRLISHLPDAGRAVSWVRFEAALNRSLSGLHGHMVCPYDQRSLTGPAGRTHPWLHDGGWGENAGYESPEQVLAGLPEPPWPVTGAPVLAVPVGDTVAGLRADIRARALAEGWLPPARLDNLLLALSELVTNGIRHGGPHRELRLWVTADAVVCEVTDDGPVPPAPLAGYLPPSAGRPGGMGLWLVEHLCDAMSIHQAGGITRARFALRRDVSGS